MLICKSCIDSKIKEWKKPFDLSISEPQKIPDYNETMQHVWDFDVPVIAGKLFNGEMLDIMCSFCKLTHIGKDQDGNIKVRYAGDPEGEWRDYVA